MTIHKIAFWVATAVLCGILLFSAGMYLFATERAEAFYVSLGFPTWIIYPSAFAKIAAVAVILMRRKDALREWAYAGVFYDVVLALTAHQIAQDNAGMLAALALMALFPSYFLGKKLD